MTMDYNNLKYLEFDWDKGNINKAQKHGLTCREIELLFQQDLLILKDRKFSILENRYIGVGELQQRGVFFIFTIRHSLIRVISARYMHKQEKDKYDNFKKEKV